jgi:sterol desaturase/sphingolipid hydroxylase (fatty acid hydroxylase superfamily)
MDPVAVAIPFFFGLIGLELAWSRRAGRPVYHLGDALAALGCGVIDQVGAVFLEFIGLAAWGWVAAHARLWALPADSPWTWLFALLAVDFTYYLWHRASHRLHFLWAVHAVHHQSDEYNLAVALRQAVFAQLTAWPFYLWLAVVGLPLPVYAAVKAINLLYQFWIHTRLIDRLGPLELLLNTPSHHRVHHGINRAYIDRNYAGIFIFWDRLLGTFAPEVEEPRYGTVQAFRSWDPFWAQLAPWAALYGQLRRARRWSDRLRLFFGPPEWSPPEWDVAPIEDAALLPRPPYPAALPRLSVALALIWLLIGAGLTWLLATRHAADLGPQLLVAGLCLGGLRFGTHLLRAKA